MSMRLRYDENGNENRWHNMIFDDMPDDYIMKKILLSNGFRDVSYVGFMKQLRKSKRVKAFDDNIVYSKEVISHLALDYLDSALFLHRGIVAERGTNIVSAYLIPCAFLCKHSVELKLKECLLEKYGNVEKSHSIVKLWDTLAEKEVVHYKELSFFILELEAIDAKEISLRYGVSVKLEPVQEDFMFDIDALLNNTKFFFNVVDEYIVCKYRYKEN